MQFIDLGAQYQALKAQINDQIPSGCTIIRIIMPIP